MCCFPELKGKLFRALNTDLETSDQIRPGLTKINQIRPKGFTEFCLGVNNINLV